MTQYGDKLFNPEFRPFQFMEKTFFNIRQQLPQSEGVKGDYAYYNFAVRIPDSDQFVPAGSTEVVEGKPLPPSLVVLPGNAKTALEPVAYSESRQRNGVACTDAYRRSVLCAGLRRVARTARTNAFVSNVTRVRPLSDNTSR